MGEACEWVGVDGWMVSRWFVTSKGMVVGGWVGGRTRHFMLRVNGYEWPLVGNHHISDTVCGGFFFFDTGRQIRTRSVYLHPTHPADDP